MTTGEVTIEPLPNKKLKISIGKKSAEVVYGELWGIIFMLGTNEFRDELMPVQKKEMMVFSRKHQIKATKDIKEGETLNVWCEINIPQIIVESIAKQNGAKVIVQKEI